MQYRERRTNQKIPPVVLVDHWPSERRLRVLIWLLAIGIWLALAVSLIGMAYMVLVGIFVFVAHVTFITYLRGSAVKLSSEQMPELYERVAELAEKIGLPETPDAYIVQAGGSLNALATKFLRSNFIVLFSDLLDACGDNTDARDFIIAHELGHLYAGHLRLRWFLLPGLILPFIGTAYSRACEYTCDRYAFAASTNGERALDGLSILAAGGKHGPLVNRRALVAQRRDLNTVWMKIGYWLSTHPSIAHRLAALRPALAEGRLGGRSSSFGAVIVILLAIVLPIAGTFGFIWEVWPRIEAAIEDQRRSSAVHAEVQEGIRSLADAASRYKAKRGRPPKNAKQLYRQWSSLHPKEKPPLDPFSDARFQYKADKKDYSVWSVGPDPTDDRDDLYYSSRVDSAR